MRKRNIQKIVRFNRKEAQDLAAKAKKACLSEAGLIRLLIRGYEPKEKPDDRLCVLFSCSEAGKDKGVTLMWIDIVNKRSYNFLYMTMLLHILLSPYIIYIIFYIICPQSDSK